MLKMASHIIITIIYIVVFSLQSTKAGLPYHIMLEKSALRPSATVNTGNSADFLDCVVTGGYEAKIKKNINKIREILNTVDNKIIRRKYVKPEIEKILSELTRGEKRLLNAKQVKLISRIQSLKERLDRLEYILLLKDKGDFVFDSKYFVRILQSRRTLEEIKGLIKKLGEFQIRKGAHLANIISSSRSEKNIIRVINALSDHGITEGSNIMIILQSSRYRKDFRGIAIEDQIKTVIYMLRQLGIEKNTHIAKLLQNSRSDTNVKNTILLLRSLGINTGTYIANILNTTRSEKNILLVVNKLIELGIEDEYATSLILQSSKFKGDTDTTTTELEIEYAVKTVRALDITGQKDLANVLHCSRSVLEIEEVVNMLRGLGFTKDDNANIAKILLSGRTMENISAVIDILRKPEIGINDNLSISLILQSSRFKEKNQPKLECEIKTAVNNLRALGIRKSIYTAKILQNKRSDEKTITFIKALIGHGIVEESNIAKIFHCSRPQDKTLKLIECLRALGIENNTNIAIIVQTARSEKEILKLVIYLKSLGMDNESHIAMILQATRTKNQIERLAKILINAVCGNNGNRLSMYQAARLVANPNYIIKGLDEIYKNQARLPSVYEPLTENGKKYIQFRLFLRNFDRKTLNQLIDELYRDTKTINSMKEHLDSRITEDLNTLSTIPSSKKLSREELIKAGILLFSIDADIRMKTRNRLIENFYYMLKRYKTSESNAVATDMLMYGCANHNIFYNLMRDVTEIADIKTYLYSALRFTHVSLHEKNLPKDIKILKRRIRDFSDKNSLNMRDNGSENIIFSEFIARGYETASIELALGQKVLSLDHPVNGGSTPLVELMPGNIHTDVFSGLEENYGIEYESIDYDGLSPNEIWDEAIDIDRQADYMFEAQYSKSAASGMSVLLKESKTLSAISQAA